MVDYGKLASDTWSDAKDYATGEYDKAVNTGAGLPGGLDDDGNPVGSELQGKYNSVFGSDKIWSILGKNWDQIFTYRFIIESNSKTYQFALPIPPQQLLTKPMLPSKVTPTIGGVVEEVSPVKFWMISMSGTTGTAASRTKGDEFTRKKTARKFREVIETTGLLAGVFANARQLANKAASVTSAITDGNVIGAFNDALTPQLPYASSAVDENSNGFVESKELEKFFYMYHALKANDPDNFKLFFINHKTNQQWRVSVKDFQLQQSVQNPNLYRYQISLQGWDVKSPKQAGGDENSDDAYDRFGKNGDLKSVNTTNVLDSLLKTRKNLLYSVRNSAKGLGNLTG